MRGGARVGEGGERMRSQTRKERTVQRPCPRDGAGGISTWRPSPPSLLRLFLVGNQSEARGHAAVAAVLSQCRSGVEESESREVDSIWHFSHVIVP